jgi:hypothetical protein
MSWGTAAAVVAGTVEASNVTPVVAATDDVGADDPPPSLPHDAAIIAAPNTATDSVRLVIM